MYNLCVLSLPKSALFVCMPKQSVYFEPIIRAVHVKKKQVSGGVHPEACSEQILKWGPHEQILKERELE